MSKALNCSSRFMMMVMVLVFWSISALLMFMGIKMLMLIGSLDAAIDNKYLSLPAVVLILLSLLCLVIGIIGCAGASFESRKTQAVFFVLLLLILLLEVGGFFLCIAYKEQLHQKVYDTSENSLKHYNGSSDDSLTNSIDYIQETFECCGVNDSSDWAETPWGMVHKYKVPGSCCNGTNCNTTIPVQYDQKSEHYDKGCAAKIYGRVSGWLVWLIVLAVFFISFEVLALCCTCVRFRQSKKVKYQTLSEENARGGYRA